MKMSADLMLGIVVLKLVFQQRPDLIDFGFLLCCELGPSTNHTENPVENCPQGGEACVYTAM